MNSSICDTPGRSIIQTNWLSTNTRAPASLNYGLRPPRSYRVVFARCTQIPSSPSSKNHHSKNNVRARNCPIISLLHRHSRNPMSMLPENTTRTLQTQQQWHQQILQPEQCLGHNQHYKNQSSTTSDEKLHHLNILARTACYGSNRPTPLNTTKCSGCLPQRRCWCYWPYNKAEKIQMFSFFSCI